MPVPELEKWLNSGFADPLGPHWKRLELKLPGLPDIHEPLVGGSISSTVGNSGFEGLLEFVSIQSQCPKIPSNLLISFLLVLAKVENSTITFFWKDEWKINSINFGSVARSFFKGTRPPLHSRGSRSVNGQIWEWFEGCNSSSLSPGREGGREGAKDGRRKKGREEGPQKCG